MGAGGQPKPVLYFHDRQKGMVLNVTNCREIEGHFGDSENWPGKSIELFSTKVPLKGNIVDGVRVRVPKEASADELLSADPAQAPIKPATKAELDEELNDSVPF